MPITPEQVHAAALDAIRDALASEAGPDGLPSLEAKKKAKRIMDYIADPAAVEALCKEGAE